MSKEKLNAYVEKCFKDSFKSEEREYNKKLYSADYVIIYDSKNIGHFYPIMSCKYTRVLRRVTFRLKNNIRKNFNLIFENSDEFRCSIDPSGIIDFNFTRAMVVKKSNSKEKFGISIIDDLDKLPIDGGQYIPAYRYEQLVIKYYGLKPRDYIHVGSSDGEFSLPSSLSYDWGEFKKLWEDTFKQDICPYEIILSDGLVRL